MRPSRKRILIVNCYVDETRQPVHRTQKIPQAMGPAYLAGAFADEHCDIRLVSELASGPLEDERLLAWPDMLVLTGLTTALDRMLHLTAYARTKNPRVVVVAGGHAIRALPRYCARFFDYACTGDVEQLQEVIREALGAAYVGRTMQPRFDLAAWLRHIGYVESSRYCNFRCTFCTLTGEDRPYRPYALDDLRRHVRASGRRRFLVFIDNNFYGVDRAHFRAKLALLGELRREGWFSRWTALVTSDFFFDDENLRLARESGCITLFSGVESFDDAWLRGVNKSQNVRLSPVELVRKTHEAGIVFLYGLVLDLATRRVADVERELDAILDTPDLTLPSYVSVSIPILGTPFFSECLERGILLPRTRVRDLDGTTLALRPRDDLPRVEQFVRDLQQFRGRRARILGHAYGYARRWRGILSPWQITVGGFNGAILAAPLLTSAPRELFRRGRRTHVSTTEVLDRVYRPAFPVASRFESYFAPTMLTDAAGRLTEALAPDLVDDRRARPVLRGEQRAAATSV
jgi:hypothetical protein